MAAYPNKRTVLFVDDRAKRIDWAIRKYYQDCNLIIAPNVPEALRALSSHIFQNNDLIYLDFDLNGHDFQSAEDKTSGMEIIRYIESFDMLEMFSRGHVRFFIHSTNIFAAAAMVKYLMQRGVYAERTPINYEEI